MDAESDADSDADSELSPDWDTPDWDSAGAACLVWLTFAVAFASLYFITQ